MIYVDDVPDEIDANSVEICLELPDAYEEQAWKGTRWMVRKKTFAHVLGVVDESKVPDGADPRTADGDVVLSFRAAADELDVLRNTGHPFFYRPGVATRWAWCSTPTPTGTRCAGS